MRKIIKKLHLYFALILCIPLVLQGLSGALLVFEREILEKKIHISSEEKIHSASEIISAAKKKIPEGYSANFIKIDEAATVRFSQKIAEKNSVLEVKIDPTSLEIFEIKNPQENFFNTIKKFHTNLLIQGAAGRNIIGCYGLVMLFMAISGLIIWWPRKGNWSRALTFKFSSTGRKFHRDLHGAIGFWTSIILLISSFSGTYLAFPQATGNLVAKIFSGKNFTPANEIKVTPNDEKPLAIDQAITLATSSAPQDAKFFAANIPTKSDQPFRINFTPKNYEDGEPLIIIFVDQWQKKIIEKRNPASYSITEKIISWQHALHVGQGLGVAWKITIFLTGFLPLLFSITGISIWWLKKKEKKLRKNLA